MTKHDKLIKRFKSQPKDFTYDEMRSFLSRLGYVEETKGKTSGSRVIFYNEELQHSIFLHKPHPSNIIKSYLMKYVEDELTAKGLI
jgi:hypothetical protein